MGKKSGADLKIYIVTKNAKGFPKGDHFQPIQGGRALTTSVIPGTIGDDSGDNISLQNEYFAELSSMYWVWKNAVPSKYVGFFHYRRFLNFGEPLCPEEHWSVRNFSDFSDKSIERFGWSKARILDAIGDSDIVLPTRELVTRPPNWDSVCSIYTHYRNSHMSRDINLTMEAMKDLYPKKYSSYYSTMHDTWGYFCHLYVMKWDIFCDYMDWSFSIYRYVADRIDLHAELYLPHAGQTRVFGFIGERIFNAYLEERRAQGLKFREFERLFGKLPADSTVELKLKKFSRGKIIETFHKGARVRFFDHGIDFFKPD